jgi:alpha-tubulin suppressor-like RCC1 family protein
MVAVAFVGVWLAGCTPTAGSDPVVDIGAGGIHTCAVRKSGKVACWGDNSHGQLGNGTNTSSAVPVGVPGVSGATAVTGGEHHTCVIVTGGAVRCWGRNDHGQLGNGLTTDSNVPVSVSGLSSGVVAIDAGMFHTCALLVDRTVKCWGEGDSGQLGNDKFVDSSTPVAVSALSNVARISAGGADSCAVTVSGTAMCWGDNTDGQLGLSSFSPIRSADPLQSASTSPGVYLGSISQIGVGPDHVCVVRTLNDAYCWGRNDHGGLGNGVPLPGATSNSAVQVSGLTVAAQPDSGQSFSCSTLALGGVNCWGTNNLGQLGNGGSPSESSTKVVVTGLTSISKVSAGDGHACALRSVGTVSCWGWDGFGQIGDGGGSDRLNPVVVF